MPDPVVGIIGLKALNRDLRKMADEGGAIQKAMAAAGKVAIEPVLNSVRNSLPNVSGDLVGTLRGSGTKTGATVRLGTAKVNYAGPVDFGGWPRPSGGEGGGDIRWTKGAFHRVSGAGRGRQLGDVVAGGRPFIATGRYLYPGAQSLAMRAAELYTDALTKALAAAGWSNDTESGAAVHD